MNTFKASAITILSKSATPLHYKDITAYALDAGILQTNGATPEATMNAQILMDIKNKGDASRASAS
jgi:restriction system protein